ncbi:hypothetical protein LX32DRAFT_418068 [Colletotrichum zoysiae]|uniref:Uncharacterized protein n=1 Tax=Colletotrichum zoysiae TaxID=1216348 RepID=A0AAD9M4K5_9PEZI|nr:hypothetical protein LX32DRAFT_418068 [Colletotrichum zoysiae]
MPLMARRREETMVMSGSASDHPRRDGTFFSVDLPHSCLGITLQFERQSIFFFPSLLLRSRGRGECTPLPPSIATASSFLGVIMLLLLLLGLARCRFVEVRPLSLCLIGRFIAYRPAHGHCPVRLASFS